MRLAVAMSYLLSLTALAAAPVAQVTPVPRDERESVGADQERPQPATDPASTRTRGGSITGIVVDEACRPVQHADVVVVGGAVRLAAGDVHPWATPVSVVHASVKTDAGGRFLVHRLPLGEHRVRVVHPAYCRCPESIARLDVDRQMEDLRFVRVRSGTRLRGRCRNARPGGGVTLVEVRAVEGNGEGLRDGAPTGFLVQAAQDGTFALPHAIPAGTYTACSFQLPQVVDGVSFPDFDHVPQMQATQRRLVIQPGQVESVQDFDLTVLQWAPRR